MRILITNHSLEHVGGTEKWVYAMAREFQRQGDEVEVFTFHTGLTADKLEEAGIPVVRQPGPGYDLILINHATCLSMMTHTDGYKIFTSHGPLHPLEQPGPGADAYVGVSEEVCAGLRRKGYAGTLIRNGIDLTEFVPAETRHDTPHVLSMCKIPQAGAMVAQAAQNQGVPFRGVHYLEAPVWDMAPVIQEADLVFACGRSAYEALSCGKEVVVFDARSGRGPRADGLLTFENVYRIAQCNCSGRFHNRAWTVADIEEAIYQYAPSDWSRAWTYTHTNVHTAAIRYLTLLPYAEDDPEPSDNLYVKV